MAPSDINLLTPEMLNKDPTLLLHKRGTNPGSITAFDGRVGAVVHDGYFFVTSPNEDVIFYPPLGNNRKVRLRKDYRFGDDDPILWPQPYLASFCHFGAIPRKPLDNRDPLAIMWWTPNRTFFIPSTANIITGVGQLEFQKLAAFGLLIDTALQHVETYKSDPSYPEKNKYCLHAANSLKHAFVRLQSLPMSWRQVQFGVAHVQRYYLEVIAILDYLYVFKLRMDGDLPPATHVEDRIGAFTTEPLIAQEFFRAGLPIWLVRRYVLLPAIRIDSMRVPRIPNDLVCLEDELPPFRVIFTGAATKNEKYLSMHAWIRSFIQYCNPFDVYVESDGPPSVIPVSSGSLKARDTEKTECSKMSRSHHPYKTRTTQKYAGGRNKYVEPTSPLVPPAIPAWRDALLEVDSNPSNLLNQRRPSDRGYIFPDPGLFVGVTTSEKQSLYFENWLKYRTEIIFRLVSDKSTARPVSNQMWRTLLNFGGSLAAEGSTTKTARRRQEIVELLGNCVKEEGIGVSHSPSQTKAFWRDQQVTSGIMLKEETACEILWELFELNFRFEFLALDARANTSTIEDGRQNDIMACFPGGSLLLAKTELANQGLASTLWSDRIPYLFAMRKLMKTWRDSPPSITEFAEKRMSHSKVEILALERALTSFYTQSFFNHFGRAAVVPHRLY